MHLVITDSGLGGLAVCAALERAFCDAGVPGVRLTYVNAWPFEDRGYNDLPDMAARAAVFDAALTGLAARAPDSILIACNTLSIVYGFTAFCRTPAVPVRGIVEAGVSLFDEALGADPESSIVLLGTKTTIESGIHRNELRRRGIDAGRIAAVSCHGLAGAIEREPEGARVAELLDTCTARVCDAQPSGGTLLVGLCCTHYGYVSGRIESALAAATGRPVRCLDPNQRLVTETLSGLACRPGAAEAMTGPAGRAGRDAGVTTVNVVSKVTLTDASRAGIARLVEPVSPRTANALLAYSHVPDLF